MTTPLFLDQQATDISFEKMAMPIKLSDNVDNWQKEVSSEIYKFLPFLSNYTVNVIFQRVNPERGYAFGSAEVTTPTDQPSAEGPKVIIPIIVKDRLMAPADIFLFEDKAFPMSEQRVSEALFDGRTFEPSTRKPVDQGMVDQLHPPIRTNYGYGSGVTTGAAAGGAGFGKFASLMEAIAPTISDEDAVALVEKIAKDQQLLVAVQVNPNFHKMAHIVTSTPRTSVQKTAGVLVQSIQPTVVQFIKQADGNFKIKWANAGAFSPQEASANPQEAQQMAGTDSVQQMQPGDSMTVGTEEAKPSLDDPTPAIVGDFGQYQVQIEETGEDKTGWVIPVMDFDMDKLPLFLFTDGESSYSLQDEIVGVRVGDDAASIPEAPPQGDGAFFYIKPDGSVCALPPVTVQNQTQDEQGNPGFIVQDAFGNDITLMVTQGLNTIEATGEGTYAIPDTMKFTPLGEAVHVVKTPSAAEQVKEARAFSTTGWIRSTGKDEFHLSGLPFSKLAQVQWLDKQAAEFLLVTAGLNQFQAREKLAEAQRQGRTTAEGLLTITPLEHVHQEAIKEASVLLGKFPYDLRRDLVKEAAALEDSETADRILAMNFLNPENIAIFASYLPQMDETVQRLAEMLMAARMGMSQVDEGAIERSMKNLEEVIQGLRGLQQKQLL